MEIDKDLCAWSNPPMRPILRPTCNLGRVEWGVRGGSRRGSLVGGHTHW